MSDQDELDDDVEWFGKNHAKKIDRILKRALQRARDRGLKAAEAGGGPNVFKDTMAAARASYTRTMKKAVVKQAGVTQKSVRVETPRGRNFHLRVDTLKPNSDGKSAAGKAAASNQYIERENAVEIGEVDIWATVDRQKELEAAAAARLAQTDTSKAEDGFEREVGRGQGAGFQTYIERDEAVERAARGNPINKDRLAFSFGTIGDTPEDRASFWEKIETHLPGNRVRQFKMILELPHEATPQTRLNIMLDFTRQMFKERDIPFWCALHSPIEGVNDPRNYHAHIVYIGRPAKIIDHHEKVMIDRHGRTRHEGQAIREWDFACPVSYKKAGHNRITYPYRQGNDPTLRVEHRKMTPIHARFAKIVNQHMRLAGLPVRYDPTNASLQKQGQSEFRDLQRNAVELIKGKRSVDKEVYGFRDIFENEILRAKRDENFLRARIEGAEVRMKELRRDTNPHETGSYFFAMGVWKHAKAQVSYVQRKILAERLKADRERLAAQDGREVELALYTALHVLRQSTKDKEERQQIDDMLAPLKQELDPALIASRDRERAIRKMGLGYQKWFRETGKLAYDPTVDLAMRSVAKRYGFTIPDQLKITPPPSVTMHDDRIPSTGYVRPGALPYEIRDERISEFTGKVSVPADEKNARALNDIINSQEEKIATDRARILAELDRQRRQSRRKALLSKKNRGGIER